jgi:hypothetical protein
MRALQHRCSATKIQLVIDNAKSTMATREPQTRPFGPRITLETSRSAHKLERWKGSCLSSTDFSYTTPTNFSAVVVRDSKRTTRNGQKRAANGVFSESPEKIGKEKTILELDATRFLLPGPPRMPQSSHGYLRRARSDDVVNESPRHPDRLQPESQGLQVPGPPQRPRRASTGGSPTHLAQSQKEKTCRRPRQGHRTSLQELPSLPARKTSLNPPLSSRNESCTKP